jgi:acetyltransferase-like isoleucine patch superfamily enzyme
MQHEPAQEIEHQGNHEYGSLVSPIQKENELSKQTPQVPLVEQQETHDELVAQVDSPSAPAGEVIDGQSELVVCAEMPSKTDCEGATFVPPSVDMMKEYAQVPLTVKPSLGCLEIQEAHICPTQHTPSLLGVGKDFDDITSVQTCSGRPISPSLHQSGLIEQYVADCAINVPVSSTDELRTEPSVPLPQQTFKARSESTSEQVFAKHPPTLPTENRNVEALLPFAADHTKWAPCILEQIHPQKDDAERCPSLPSLYKHVQIPEATPVRTSQGRIEEIVHTTYDEPTAPAMDTTSTIRQLVNGCRMDNSFPLRMDTSSNSFNGKTTSTRDESVQPSFIENRKRHPGDNQLPQRHGFRAINQSCITTAPTPQADHSVSTVNVSKSVERATRTEPTRADVQEEAKNGRRPMTRTRTGCGTCRKRKKKCDEAKPGCENCARSGLCCGSYGNTKLLPKIRVVKPLPLLQAQEQVPTAKIKHNSQVRAFDFAQILNSELGVDSSHITHGESHPSIESATELDRHSTSENRNSQELASNWGTGQGNPSLPRASLMQPLPTPMIGYNRDVSNKNFQVAHSIPHPRPQSTEKQKMLNGEPFLPYDVQLLDERTKCAGIVQNFNITGSASKRMSAAAQAYFKEIIEARRTQPRYGESPVSSHFGVGVGVHVATPFYCDYGYNISIDDNVIIGPDCQLLDSARITIGKDAKIGARVIITTLETPKDPKTLKGACGTEVAKEIYIGANVYIGDGCIVEAGVRIGNGVIIGSRSVIVHNIPLGYVARGNPAS